MTVRIDLHNLGKTFGPTRVLTGVTCALRAGEITAILGANGAGKSTLLKIMGGVLPPTSGTLRAGAPLGPIRTVREALKANLRFIHQEGSLIPAWTVAEHFADEGSEAWSAIAPGVAGAAIVERLNAHDRQLIEVARALRGAPIAILADEPTAGLSPAERDRVFDQLRAAAAKGAAVVLVTHDLDAASTVADRVLILRSGGLQLDAPARGLTRADILGAMGVGAGLPVRRGKSEADEAAAYRLPLPGGEAIALSAGVITGMIGGPFSGAAEAVRAASGLPGPGGAGRAGKPPKGVAYLSREMAEWDFPGLDLGFNLNAATFAPLARRGVLSRSAERAQARTLAERFRVSAPSLDHPVEQLSGGNRQKAALARLAAARPRVLLLDEPFSGVDAPTRQALDEELRRLAADGMTIGIYSQELSDLIAACDRIAVAGDDGRVSMIEAEGATPALIEALLADHVLQTQKAAVAP